MKKIPDIPKKDCYFNFVDLYNNCIDVKTRLSKVKCK